MFGARARRLQRTSAIRRAFYYSMSLHYRHLHFASRHVPNTDSPIPALAQACENFLNTELNLLWLEEADVAHLTVGGSDAIRFNEEGLLLVRGPFSE